MRSFITLRPHASLNNRYGSSHIPTLTRTSERMTAIEELDDEGDLDEEEERRLFEERLRIERNVEEMLYGYRARNHGDQGRLIREVIDYSLEPRWPQSRPDSV